MVRTSLLVTCLFAAPTLAQMEGDTDVPPTAAERQTPSELSRPLDEPMALREELGLAIANAYGFSHWEQVEEIRFTFNVRRPDSDEPMSRAWTWKPETGEVTRHGEGGAGDTTYNRSAIESGEASEQLRKIDHQFINDSYWLLFPFQIVWASPQLSDHGQQPLPIRPRQEGESYSMPPEDEDIWARMVTVQYPKQGGYTPGDAYDLYLDDNDRIVQWVFWRGGKDDPHTGNAKVGNAATWDANRQLGPIIVATEHRGPDGNVRLWFTDLQVKVKADDGEVATHEPEPLREEP